VCQGLNNRSVLQCLVRIVRIPSFSSAQSDRCFILCRRDEEELDDVVDCNVLISNDTTVCNRVGSSPKSVEQFQRILAPNERRTNRLV